MQAQKHAHDEIAASAVTGKHDARGRDTLALQQMRIASKRLNELRREPRLGRQFILERHTLNVVSLGIRQDSQEGLGIQGNGAQRKAATVHIQDDGA